MRLALALAALVVGVVPGWAESPKVYIFDVLKRSEYASSYNRMMKGERGIPDWFANARGAAKSTTTPGRTVLINGSEEELFVFCQPHQCADATFAVLFSSDGERAVGGYYDTEQVIFFGNPTLAEKLQIEAASKGGI